MPVSAISRVRGIGAGREGQHVDPFGHLLDRLLVRHPEALLLVHDEQAETLERDVGRQQPMGTHDDVDRPVGQTVHHLTRLGRRKEPAQHLDAQGIPGEALGEGLVMLAGQQGRGYQHCGLAAVLHRLEDGAHRHLGLAEPDVPAHQAVHGSRLLHVGLHLGDGP